ncbi:sulfatase [Aliiglaciecola sp. 3_MG-2023]|uniref:sulfatase family protein n=1 Tax=Aliiglaciecola sp. 3_MG-2023 TaxID=3062644 RepID=UPI0026E462FD|nr:sulfatase [Aliiglaciecola sp. 3_MG-2023]MDO6693295.1 sulfatase [Aliiglaciecola sp. 3_MG-2023]
MFFKILKTFSLLVISFQTMIVCDTVVAATHNSKQTQQPNILWLVLEDMSPILPAYGDNTISTPNISWLANEGVKYTNVYSTSGVCAPSRAGLALGMYPSAVGANHMRTTSHTNVTGLPKYAAVPPPEAKMLSQYMRELGYYTTNNYKTDYQFEAPKNAWDESGIYAHWRNRPTDKPFFAVVNFTTTHESGLFEPYGIREIESRHYFADDAARIAKLSTNPNHKTAHGDTPIHVPKDLDFPIPPYLPDTPVVRRDLWKMYNNLAETDRQIGAVLEQLKQDGLLDSTIIFFYSDHGGPLPRQKRLVYDSGLKVPLIIRFPDGQRAGEVDDRLVSFVDFAPATMKLAGMDTPRHMHGQDFIQNGLKEREYIHAAADRFDEFTDVIRAVKNKRFKYIRNYRPEQGYYLPVTYREKIPTMQALLRLRNAEKLTPYQAQWFRQSKQPDELFDTLNDPHELHNLANDPAYAKELKTLSKEMDRWLAEVDDRPTLPENELITKLWQGSKTQPKTADPEVKIRDDKVYLSSRTQGASISYKLISNNYEPVAWEQYLGPFDVSKDTQIQVVAQRIGYRESEIQNLVLLNTTGQ